MGKTKGKVQMSRPLSSDQAHYRGLQRLKSQGGEPRGQVKSNREPGEKEREISMGNQKIKWS